jgi:hypothetical protein
MASNGGHQMINIDGGNAYHRVFMSMVLWQPFDTSITLNKIAHLVTPTSPTAG